MFGCKTNIPDSHPWLSVKLGGGPQPQVGPLYQRTQDKMQFPVSLLLPSSSSLHSRRAARASASAGTLRQQGPSLSQALRRNNSL